MINRRQIIAITGKAQTGKSTVAQYLHDWFNFKQESFAEPLREVCATTFNRVPKKYWHKDEFKNADLTDYGMAGETPRSLLQFVGTDLFREKWPAIWVDHMHRRLAETRDRTVITDCRFPNELDMIKSLCRPTIVIEMVRPGATGQVGIPGHASESHNLPATHTIENNGGFIDLYMKVDDIINKEGWIL